MGENSENISPPFKDQLIDFIFDLQLSGFSIDTRQIMDLNDLFLLLVDYFDTLDDLDHLKTLIAPIICKSSKDQEKFYQLYEKWGLKFKKSLYDKPDQIDEKTSQQTSHQTKKTIITISLILGLSTILIELILLVISNFPKILTFFYYIWNWFEKLSTKNLIAIGFVAFLTLAIISIEYIRENKYIARKFTNQDSEPFNIPVKDLLQNIFPKLSIKGISNALRRRIRYQSNDIDVEKTITNALIQNNWMKFIYRQSQSLPEYLVLIDQKSYLDQQAHFLIEILKLLKNEGILIHIYVYKTDPRVCFSIDNNLFPLQVDDLCLKHPECRLWFFCEASCLQNPLSGELQSWLELLSIWPERIIFSSNPIKKYVLEALIAQGFTVLPLSLDGISSITQSFDSKQLKTRVNNYSPIPDELKDRPKRWTGRDPISEIEINSLISELKISLGEKGFYWLCACAVYPEMKWDLTLYLGSVLKDNNDQYLVDTDLLLKLTQLPWFRYGYIPNWFRLVLIRNFTIPQEQSVRGALINLFSFPLLGNNKIYTINRKIIMRSILRNLKNQNIAKDQILVMFLLNKDSRKLSVLLPDFSRINNLIREKNLQIVSIFEKMMFDAIFASISLIILLIYFPLISFLIILDTGSPILVKIPTLGKGGRIFNRYLFRTTVNQSHLDHEKVTYRTFSDEPISRIGKFLRKSGFHELPELVNILRGEMSAIGPHPISIDQGKLIENKHLNEILAMRPGITGPWKNKNYSEWISSDLDYVNNWSYRRDEEIILGMLKSLLTFRSQQQNSNNELSEQTENQKKPLKILLLTSSIDEERIKKFSSLLRKFGIDVYELENFFLQSSKGVKENIQEIIHNVDLVLMCFSNTSIKENNQYKIECKYALHEQKNRRNGMKFIIPIRFNKCSLPSELRNLQFVDIFASDGLQQLTQVLKIATQENGRVLFNLETLNENSFFLSEMDNNPRILNQIDKQNLGNNDKPQRIIGNNEFINPDFLLKIDKMIKCLDTQKLRVSIDDFSNLLIDINLLLDNIIFFANSIEQNSSFLLKSIQRLRSRVLNFQNRLQLIKENSFYYFHNEVEVLKIDLDKFRSDLIVYLKQLKVENTNIGGSNYNTEKLNNSRDNLSYDLDYYQSLYNRSQITHGKAENRRLPVVIYTDGGCDPNPGQGGWAAILQVNGKTIELSGSEAQSTNNRMELTAAIQGLKALKEPSTVTLYTDSTYVQKGMTEWMPGWLRKNWRGSSGPVLNVDLWKELLEAAKPHKVTWEWVKGHSSNRFNARADALVHQARIK